MPRRGVGSGASSIWITAPPNRLTEVLLVLYNFGCRSVAVHQVDPRARLSCERVIDHLSAAPRWIWIEAEIDGDIARVVARLLTEHDGVQVDVEPDIERRDLDGTMRN